MKKRSIYLMTAVIMIFNLLPSVWANAATSISLGDYVEMGTYYDKPILWRCVSFEKIKGYDDEGNPIIDSTDTVTEYKEGYLPLMLSDKILCIKPFDASGTNTSGSHGRGYYANGTQGYYRQNYGSNYWADSNMRSWLNSTASAGNVVWLCGNPPDEEHVWNGYNEYADEAGFLTNFTKSELNAIKTVTQKSILDGYEYSKGSYNSINSNYHRRNRDVSSVVANYATAFSEQVTDTMFLLDVKQINSVYNKRGILGNNYYVGTPTEECVNNSEYKDTSLSSEKKWFSWLRTCYSQHYSSSPARNSSYMRFVDNTGSYYIYETTPSFPYSGVRPAFFLNPVSASFASGSGTASEPYIISETEASPKLSLTECTYSNNIINIDVELNNPVADGIIIAAVYDNNDKLAAMEHTRASEGVTQYTFELAADEIFEDYSVQIMLWDSLDSINYLAPAVDSDIAFVQ